MNGYRERLDAVRAKNKGLEQEQRFWHQSLGAVKEQEAKMRSEFTAEITRADVEQAKRQELERSRIVLLEELSKT